MRGWPIKAVPINSGVGKSCPLERQHAAGGCCALSLGKALWNPMGARNCCLLQIPWPRAPCPAVHHSNPAGTPAANFWPSWPGRTMKRVVTYVPLYPHILGFLSYICWQAHGRKQLLTLLVALHSSFGAYAFQQEPWSMDVNQTMTAFCGRERPCKEQGTQGGQRPVLGSQCAEVRDLGLLQWVRARHGISWRSLDEELLERTLQESTQQVLAYL